MRPVLWPDVDRAAGALLAVPEALRPRLAAQMVREADIADRWRKRFGRPHPDWGEGSLLGGARRRVSGERIQAGEAEMLRAAIIICAALLERREVASRMTRPREM